VIPEERLALLESEQTAGEDDFLSAVADAVLQVWPSTG
jgi:hypothetical protein